MADLILDIEEVRSNETARRLQDLVKEDREEYVQLRSDYNHDIRIYEREAAALRELRNWVLSTAAAKYVNACCDPTETLHAWMVKLKGVASISNNEQKSAAREEYEKTEAAMLKGQEVNLAQTRDFSEWSEDFLKVIAKTAISTFHATFEAKFHESDNPSISEISAEVRRYIRIHADTLSTGPRTSRGTFITTREGPKETMPRSATKKRHRATNSRTQNEIPTYHRYNLPRHLLTNCFYCFPEEAYEGWRPSNDIMKKVTERLKADDDLADRVKKIRFVTQAKQRHTSFTPRKRLAGRPFRWHQRLGHPGEGVLEHLVNASRGVKIIGYSWDYYLKDRTTETLLEVFDLYVAMIKTQYDIQVKIFKYSTSNSYRVWNPLTARVITTRDVVFRETEFFNRDINELRDDLKDLNVNELNALLARLEVSPTGITSPEYTHTADKEFDKIQYVKDEDTEEYTAPPSPKHMEARFELITPPLTPPTSFVAGLEEALGVKGWRKRRTSITPKAVHVRESIHKEFPITTPRTS
ncbi:gag protein [Colletotrichum musicola]|uniref:Gag protein n=1 Tax=Colletotrichum musicola TaxID=2175873 RepID=A0A8H6J009_9PEZI|nr:gag protein [Colletotrichum musicola]